MKFLITYSSIKITEWEYTQDIGTETTKTLLERNGKGKIVCFINNERNLFWIRSNKEKVKREEKDKTHVDFIQRAIEKLLTSKLSKLPPAMSLEYPLREDGVGSRLQMPGFNIVITKNKLKKAYVYGLLFPVIFLPLVLIGKYFYEKDGLTLEFVIYSFAIAFGIHFVFTMVTYMSRLLWDEEL